MPIPAAYHPIPSSSARHGPSTSTRGTETCLDSTQSNNTPENDVHGTDNPVEKSDNMPAASESPGETREQLIARVKREQRGPRQPWTARAEEVDIEPATPDRSRIEQDLELLPSPPLPDTNAGQESSTAQWYLTEQAASIERPRSALHSGDFHGNASDSRASYNYNDTVTHSAQSTDSQWMGTSPPAPWLAHRLPNVKRPNQRLSLECPSTPENFWTLPSISISLRSRASSQSSGFVFRPPTSPLANQSNIADLDPRNGRNRSKSPDKTSRRRTYSPASLRTLSRAESDITHQRTPGRPLPNLRREGTFPYQAHQPRRSLSSFSDALSFGVPHTPSAHTRRPSLASESSPLQQLPMVGRYEESILRGRMSSLPSKPVEFVAQIGVLGKGDCKPSLKCPPHVTVPFPAVFYHYGDRPGTSSHEGPSPYVGRIDLERNLKRDHKAKRRRITKIPGASGHHSEAMDIDDQAYTTKQPRRKVRRSDDGSKDHPQGTYRIPEQGQLQVVVKNPNKTAVKLFLIPYDLRGMEPGQKTWVRQRSYSAGPILDKAISSKPDKLRQEAEDPNERPMLRYLIHLHICCISKGRYYLYREIRIVFANRVPDGKEKLRQEISLPDPRFTTYRPDRRDSKGDAISIHGASDPLLNTSRPEKPTMETPPGSEVSTGGRPNFAWQSFAQTETHATPFKSLPAEVFAAMPVAHDGESRDIEMMDASPLSRPSSRRTNNEEFLERSKSPTLNPALFERLSREQWSPNGGPARAGSPVAGESLIALQHRTWSERMSSSDDASH